MKEFILGLEITKLSHKIIRALEAEIICSVDKNMSATTARIICYVVENYKEKDVFQKDIEEFMGLNRSSVSLTLSSIEKNDFILRSSVSHDARYKKILPTEKAINYYQKITNAFDKVEDKMKLGLDDFKSLSVVFDTINKNLED